VLRDVSLGIGAGEFVCIVGASGSGKTTLLNIMGGLDRGFSGQVQIGERRLADLGDRRLSMLRNRQFGFVFQQFNLLDHLTAAENVALPSYFAAKPDSETQTGRANIDARAGELLDQVGLGDKHAVRPPQLSGGQKQRVAIARALFHQPSIIFCDEPTGSLDRRTGLQIMELFRHLNRRENRTLIIVTHEEHIARMASRIVRLEDGVLVADEPNEPLVPADADLLDAGAADLARGTT
jgi:putative ABC transport system ATP-binding protein